MRKNSVKEILDETKKFASMMKRMNEAYVFDDSYEGEEEMPMQQPEIGHNEMEHGESEEEKQMHANEVIQHEPIIAKIREIAIDGLKKYADHPTSEIYNFFKKVFLDSDKVLTGEGK